MIANLARGLIGGLVFPYSNPRSSCDVGPCRSGPTHHQPIMMAAKAAIGISLVLLSVSSGAIKVPCGFIQPSGVHPNTAAVIRWTPRSQANTEPLRFQHLEGSLQRKHIILYDGPMGRGPGPQVRLSRLLFQGTTHYHKSCRHRAHRSPGKHKSQ